MGDCVWLWKGQGGPLFDVMKVEMMGVRMRFPLTYIMSWAGLDR